LTVGDKLLTVGGRSARSDLLQPARIIRFEAPLAMAVWPAYKYAGGDAEKGAPNR